MDIILDFVLSKCVRMFRYLSISVHVFLAYSAWLASSLCLSITVQLLFRQTL